MSEPLNLQLRPQAAQPPSCLGLVWLSIASCTESDWAKPHSYRTEIGRLYMHREEHSNPDGFCLSEVLMLETFQSDCPLRLWNSSHEVVVEFQPAQKPSWFPGAQQ